jgi:hypothetical protein
VAGRRGRGWSQRRVVGAGGKEAVAAQWAGGVVVVEPGLQAGAMEEVAVGEPVHYGLRLEVAQAHPAVRAGVAPPEP